MNVIVPAMQTYSVGDEVALECASGYDQSGATSCQCGANGQFSVIDTVCTQSK